MKKYVGFRSDDGAQVVVDESGHSTPLPLKPSLKLWNHSPDGFEWGYGGSGPAQLALAILLDRGLGKEEAVALHQEFKRVLVAGLPKDGWTLTETQIDDAIAKLKDDTIAKLKGDTIAKLKGAGMIHAWNDNDKPLCGGGTARGDSLRKTEDLDVLTCTDCKKIVRKKVKAERALKVEVNPANPNSRFLTERLPSGHKLTIDVSVGHDLRRLGRLTKATIGMHSFGCMTPDDATAVSKALREAVKVARKLDKQNGN